MSLSIWNEQRRLCYDAVVRRLICVTGQEGTGKSTIVPALLPYLSSGTCLDAEAVGQTHPWEMNDAFMHFLWANVRSFIVHSWAAGFETVVVGSFFSTRAELMQFLSTLPDTPDDIIVILLRADRQQRDERRLNRAKPTSAEWRDIADKHHPEDTTLEDAQGAYTFLKIDSSEQTLEETLSQITTLLPSVCRTAG